MSSYMPKRKACLFRRGQRNIVPSPQNGISRIDHAVLDDSVDIRRVLDVIERIGIENHEIGEISIFNLANIAPVSPPKSFAALAVAHWRICIDVSPACFISWNSRNNAGP